MAGNKSFLDDYNVRFITVENGLQHNFVDDLHVDSNGFLWVSMAGGGLSRYDGYEFTNFNPNFKDRYVKSAFVMETDEDAFGRLWVATDGGINVIDINTLEDAFPGDPEGNLSAVSDSPAWSVEVAADGNVWIATVDGISRIKLAGDGSVADVASFNPPYRFVNKLVIRDVWDSGRAWASVDGVITEFSVDNGGHLVAIPVSEHLRISPTAYVTDYIVKDGEVWIATESGLWRYSKADNQVKKYVHADGDPNSLSQNFVNCLAVTHDKRLVAGTLRGLNVYNPIRDDFSRILDCGDVNGCRGLNNNFVNCMLADGDRLWIGTESGGINLFSPNGLALQTFKVGSDLAPSVSSHPVNSIYEDSDGMIWIGTIEGGLSRTDRNFSRFETFNSGNSPLTGNSVSALAEDPKGRLWVGTWGDGINVMSRDRNPARLAYLNTALDGSKRIDFVGEVIYDSINDGMWVGCGRGLYYCDINSLAFSEPFEGASDMVTGSVAAVITPDGHLWIGGNSGLYEVDLRGRDSEGHFPYRHLNYKLDDPSDKNIDKIASLHIDNSGCLWVGTNGSGVYRRTVDDSGRESFENINTGDGLSNGVVFSIIGDGYDRLWFGTGHGLSCRVKNGRFLNYYDRNGLQRAQFFWNAFCRLSDGRLAFGTTDGLVVVDPTEVKMPSNKTKVWFTGLKVGRQDMPLKSGVSIHEGDKTVSLNFSALDYDTECGGEYYYRLSNFEPDWVKLPPGHHSVEYTNLSPGHYDLQVRYLSPGMSFSEAAVTSLPIEVRPYLYKRWWFVLLILAFVGGCIMLVHRWRVRDLMSQKLLLQRSVDQRTSEITMQKRMLEDRAVELSKQNEQLKLSNEEIMTQKTRLADMARKVQELSVDRISFFTNITHEFRTPITLIIGPIERALKLSYNPQVIEQLHFAERNSKYLLSLVNQLMDFRKVESGKMEIVRSYGNFRQFITDTVESFRPLAADRKIDLRLVCRLSSDTFSYDEEALRKVLINLLGNAVKFTPDGGRVRVYAALLPGTDPDDVTTKSLYIDVSDSGNGMDEADLERVFERFYQGNSQLKYPVAGTSGSGIGLYLCKNIVEIYGGRIWAKNNPGGRGCSFRLLLPVDSVAEPRQLAVSSGSSKHSSDGPAVEKPAVEPSASTTILVVEDNDDMRAFIRSILADHYNVIEAKNGAEALDLLMSKPVDFIVSDLMMPEMDGLELSRRVKEDFAISHIPILMLTAKASNETRLESFRTGVDEYLQKPFDEELLLARIRNILDNKRRQSRSFKSDMNVGSLHIKEESRDKMFMDKVMEVVKENYKNSYFEVGDFAEALGISRSLLNKKLQSLAGQSAGQLMRAYRMNLARELIVQNRRTRTMNISEIAYEVGFNDSKYFTRCFTKQFGVSPSAFMSEG